ncbi:MAG: RNA polymerase sigma factor [Solirubrobacterales bacterium]|nr:RNA polymerase sigma factor [Solirubrobacterales bacterium]
MRNLIRRDAGPAAGALARSCEDADAFADFYAAHAERVLVFFARRVLDAELALDLTSETFARALEGRHRYRGRTDEEEQGWLFAIARHLLAHYWRRGRVERSALQRLAIEVPHLADHELERVEALAGLDALRPRVVAALAGLPEDQRRAVELRIVQELGYAEVAAATGVSEQVARARVSRGLRALSQALGAATARQLEGAA